MATRLYFNPTIIYPYITKDQMMKSSYASGWTNSASAYPYPMMLVPVASRPSAVLTYSTFIFPYARTATTGTDDVSYLMAVSPPLQAQSLSGTVKGQLLVAESNTSANRMAQMRVYLMNSSGVITATLFNGHSSALASEFATTQTNRTFPSTATATLTTTSCSANDRILVVIGTRDSATVTTSYNTTLSVQNADATNDLPSNETATNVYNPWIEFSVNFTFNTETIADAPMLSYEETSPWDDFENRIGDNREYYGETGGGGPAPGPTEGQIWPRGVV